MRATAVWDTFWWFAAERQAMYLRRLAGSSAPWTGNATLAGYRFTNPFRATDRVSQYLIAEVQRGTHRSSAPEEVFYRTILFKLFNRIGTWEVLEAQLGPMSWQSARRDALVKVLALTRKHGGPLYSAAYIMSNPPLGHGSKHENHLALLWRMMEDRLPARVFAARSLAEVYKLLLPYPGLGRFLAYQYALDLSYTDLLEHDEDFVVAGPGAIDGIAKCFPNLGGKTPEALIHWMTDRQEEEFAARGLDFPGLFGRRLRAPDLQNLACEASKVARVLHPTISGANDRTRIKQSYSPSDRPLPPPVFPERWKLRVPAGMGRHDPSPRLF